MARTNRADAPWTIRGTRRGLPTDARSGRIAHDPETFAALRRDSRRAAAERRAERDAK